MDGTMTPDEIAAELDRLNGLIVAREHRDGYKANVEAIKARIAELEAMQPV